MNYGELRTIIASRLDRPDQGTTIVDAVAAATARLTRVLRIYEQEGIADATLVSEYTELPANFNGMRSLSSGGKKLDFRPPQQFQAIVSGSPSIGTPIFTVEDSSLRVYPAPAASSPLIVAMLYSMKLEALAADSDTNPVLDEHPDLYLAATMSEVMLHMKNYDTHAVWDSRMKELAMETVIASRRKRYSGGNLAVRNSN
jgi:hypothetical protein